jgi:hypothetical protein
VSPPTPLAAFFVPLEASFLNTVLICLRTPVCVYVCVLCVCVCVLLCIHINSPISHAAPASDVAGDQQGRGAAAAEVKWCYSCVMTVSLRSLLTKRSLS